MPDGDAYYDEMLRAAGCSLRVIAHCHEVRDLALEFCDQSQVADRALVNAGALLHDIGRGISPAISHAQDGAVWCRDNGIPEEIVRIVERHTGAGLTADECTLLRLLPVDCMPETIEEKIVASADNLVKGGQRISIHDRLAASLYLDKMVRYRIYRLWLETEQFRRS
ncbi:MAG TPA: HDIG domain-containing protein [Methanoregulaceae archaeon]|nr:MAG: HDIG domain-containing protein [Methanolinea sp.]HON81087.1 HDIG domain-containing protein [Methanoregulaceae archaeon]HPD09969.1 HDIG domain-containing protein [Methanoregulaceae archaeon]HRT14840.1 HDIG domain-containing protein [Methanoregulaceae archaeon]HRU30545.1 HDIG domain-containing protein [Methanoregulaceae archaeon]